MYLNSLKTLLVFKTSKIRSVTKHKCIIFFKDINMTDGYSHIMLEKRVLIFLR